MTEKPVVIVGAGYAGLVAANRLRAANVPFVIYEASPNVAGLASTFKDMDGYSYDFGTHLITNRLATTLGISDQCRDVCYFGESIFLKGKVYAYPFGLVTVPRYTLSALRRRLAGGGTEAMDAATWSEATLGPELAREVAIPLMEALTGSPANELSPAIGNKMPNVLRTLMLRAAGRMSGKAVAIGYCQDLPETSKVWHVYPKDGIATICHHLIQGIEDHVKLRTPVQKVVVVDGAVQGVEVNGEFQPAQTVISTAPVNVLPRLIPGTDQLAHLADFRYSNMVFVNLFLRGRRLMPDVATWFPEDQFDFFRVQEPPISLPWTAPEGHTYLTVDIGCHVGDEVWTTSDEALAERCLDQLKPVIPDIRSRFQGARVLRTKIAYPVYLRAYEAERQRFSQSSGVPGLYSVGRNGEFAHILMEDVYHRTNRRVDGAVADLQRAAA
ncbi:MAG: protoporphyrinogen/coproporphyrinogen oxidase [Pseudomonadota bacterium]